MDSMTTMKVRHRGTDGGEATSVAMDQLGRCVGVGAERVGCLAITKHMRTFEDTIARCAMYPPSFAGLNYVRNRLLMSAERAGGDMVEVESVVGRVRQASA